MTPEVHFQGGGIRRRKDDNTVTGSTVWRVMFGHLLSRGVEGNGARGRGMGQRFIVTERGGEGGKVKLLLYHSSWSGSLVGQEATRIECL